MNLVNALWANITPWGDVELDRQVARALVRAKQLRCLLIPPIHVIGNEILDTTIAALFKPILTVEHVVIRLANRFLHLPAHDQQDKRANNETDCVDSAKLLFSRGQDYEKRRGSEVKKEVDREACFDFKPAIAASEVVLLLCICFANLQSDQHQEAHH